MDTIVSGKKKTGTSRHTVWFHFYEKEKLIYGDRSRNASYF